MMNFKMKGVDKVDDYLVISYVEYILKGLKSNITTTAVYAALELHRQGP